MYFKTSMGKKTIKLMLKSNLSKLGYKRDSSGAIQITFEDPQE
jgi:hypothetical protein